MSHRSESMTALHDSLLTGKLPRNLHWRAVLQLMEQIGEALPRGAGKFEFVVGGFREVFAQPHHSAELNVEEVSRLRHFLTTARDAPKAPAPANQSQLVVLIDDHSAHVYRVTADGSTDESTIKPFDPFGFHRHVVHRMPAHNRGDHGPDVFRRVKPIETADLAALTDSGRDALAMHHLGAYSATSQPA